MRMHWDGDGIKFAAEDQVERDLLELLFLNSRIEIDPKHLKRVGGVGVHPDDAHLYELVPNSEPLRDRLDEFRQARRTDL